MLRLSCLFQNDGVTVLYGGLAEHLWVISKKVYCRIFWGAVGGSLSYHHSDIILGPCGRSSRRNVYRGGVRTCQLSKYYIVTEFASAFRLLCKRECVRCMEREQTSETDMRKGIKGKETRAVIPLWPWLRFQSASGVSWPCLDSVQ